MRRVCIVLCVLVGCSEDETSAGTAGSSSVAAGSTGSSGGAGGQPSASASTGGGSGGRCPIGSNSTVVEATPANRCADPRQSALDGTAAPGECCNIADECAPTCCGCTGSSNEYLGVFCQDGVCATVDDTCTATAADGCR